MQSVEGSKQLASSNRIPLRTVLEGAWKYISYFDSTHSGKSG